MHILAQGGSLLCRIFWTLENNKMVCKQEKENNKWIILECAFMYLQNDF